MTEKLRIVFMGTPDFSVPVLEALAAAHEVVSVYCQPPRPANRNYSRGHKLQPCPVQLAAERFGIPVHSPVSFKKEPEAVDAFKQYRADLAVVVAYGLILPKTILDAPRHGCINIHASLLPRWRGAAPLQRAIEAGDRETGICIMRMEAGLDTGPVYRTARTPITDTTTLPQLHDTMQALAAREIIAALSDPLAGIVAGDVPTPQPEDGITYAAKITREESRIDWSETAAVIERRLRAFTPWPGLFFMHAGKRVKLLAAAIGPTTIAPPGTLLDAAIACGNGTSLALLRVQREGGAAQSFADFVNGARLQSGAILD